MSIEAKFLGYVLKRLLLAVTIDWTFAAVAMKGKDADKPLLRRVYANGRFLKFGAIETKIHEAASQHYRQAAQRNNPERLLRSIFALRSKNEANMGLWCSRKLCRPSGVSCPDTSVLR